VEFFRLEAAGGIRLIAAAAVALIAANSPRTTGMGLPPFTLKIGIGDFAMCRCCCGSTMA
jgi:Na+/H+ antiporter NhaA